MEERYEFDGEGVLELIEESRAAEVRRMTEAQRMMAAGIDLHAAEGAADLDVDHPGTGAPPGLWIMNDRGVYLRSNAENGGARVVHARGSAGSAPAEDDSLCEFIDADSLRQVRPGDVLVVRLSEAKIRLSLIRQEK